MTNEIQNSNGKVCKNCNCEFNVDNEDLAFYEQVSPVFNGKKESIPSPTLCPECRQQRRLASINERHLYKDNCNKCNKKILSQYSPILKYKSYCRDCWHGDDWDSETYGIDYDPSKTFFEQIKELEKNTPHLGLSTEGIIENSEYIHYAGYAKNCYLIMHSDYCEECYYGYGFKNTKNCVNGYYNLQSELLYDCIYCQESYELTGSQDCVNCHSSQFIKDCIGCKNCFLCTGLRQKEYCFENKQLSKEDYLAMMDRINLGDYSQYTFYKNKLSEMISESIVKEYQGNNLTNCSGNYLLNCKNTHSSFDCEDIEDGKYCYQIVTGAKNIQDIYQYGLKLQESYECCIAGNDCYNNLFCQNAHQNNSNIYYCYYAFKSKDCFGCVGIKNKQYNILNKQYTKEEYEELASRIISAMRTSGEYGEYFPNWFSPFGYNKTTAQMYYPLTKEDAISKGYKWDDYEPQSPQVAKTLETNQLPDNISDVSDEYLDWAIKCEITGKLFKITPQELKFYRTQKLPLPRKCPDQRHLERFQKRNPRILFDRKCNKCEKAIKTTYSPDRKEIVYCESCYLKTVY